VPSPTVPLFTVVGSTGALLIYDGLATDFAVEDVILIGVAHVSTELRVSGVFEGALAAAFHHDNNPIIMPLLSVVLFIKQRVVSTRRTHSTFWHDLMLAKTCHTLLVNFLVAVYSDSKHRQWEKVQVVLLGIPKEADPDVVPCEDQFDSHQLPFLPLGADQRILSSFRDGAMYPRLVKLFKILSQPASSTKSDGRSRSLQ